MLLLTGAEARAGGVADKEAIERAREFESKHSEYLCGHGEGESPEQALQMAMAEIVGQISVNVRSTMMSESEERMLKNGSVESRSDFRSTVESYSSPTVLEGVERVWLSQGNPYKVVCAISKAKVEDMLESRRNLVADLCREAEAAEWRTQIDDALKLYYRAYATLHTLPDADVMTRVINGHSRHIDSWIPQRMRDLCQDVRFAIAAVEESGKDSDGRSGKRVSVTATYKGEPVRSVAVTCFDGISRSGVTTFRDGVGVMEFGPTASITPLVLDIEYRFEDESNVARSLESVVRNFNGGGLLGDAPHKVVSTDKELKVDKKAKSQFNESLKAASKEGVEAVKHADLYASAMERIVAALRRGRVEDAAECFTTHGLTQFKNLLRQGKASVIGKCQPGSYSFYPMGERVVCRSIPMQFSFDSGRKVFKEDVNFTFDKDGKVESLAYGLGQAAREDIFSVVADGWPDYIKMVLVTFLENYRTAFALKDIEFIESVFDDNATIIVGGVQRTLTPTNQKELMGYRGEEIVTYARKTKDQYISDLKRCFSRNAYVNLRFYNTDVEKIGMGGDTFAIQLRQDYSSQYYGDEGYLYLLVDFNDREKPVIKIRTWQPERLKELTPNIPEDDPLHGIFSTGIFG